MSDSVRCSFSMLTVNAHLPINAILAAISDFHQMLLPSGSMRTRTPDASASVAHRLAKSDSASNRRFSARLRQYGLQFNASHVDKQPSQPDRSSARHI